MKKRLLGIAFASVMVLGLTACSLQGKDDIQVLDGPGSVVEVTEESEGEAVTLPVEPATEEATEATTGEFIVTAIQENETITINDTDLTFEEDYTDDTEESGVARVTYGTDTYAVSPTIWVRESYVIQKTTDDPDCFCILVTLLDYNDWTDTILVIHNADGFYAGDNIEGSACSVGDVNGYMVTMHSRADCLGTYGTAITYDISGGKFSNSEAIIYFENENECDDGSYFDEYTDEDALAYMKTVYDDNGRHILIPKQDFNAFNDSGQSVTILAGSTIYPIGYNPTDQIFYFEQDGTEYFVDYVKDEGSVEYTVDGISEFDLFENLPYAG